MRRSSIILGLLVAFSVAFASAANGSQVISTSTVTGLTLQVNGKGEALLTYRSHGKRVHVLAWGAENAVAPTEGGKQGRFHLDYSGGYVKYFTADRAVRALVGQYEKLKGTPGYLVSPVMKKLTVAHQAADSYWQIGFNGGCAPYDGPKLALAVAACKAPDGSYWAVQQWQRKLPNYGVKPTSAQAGMEVHLSHWTGSLPVLTIDTDWAWHRWDHLFGTFTYNGAAVYGFRSTASGQPLDVFGRNVYVDTYDSAYGPGWRRENSFLTHRGTGVFCYSVNPHGSHPSGKGSRYRATIIGPGVAPDVTWVGASPGTYDRSADAQSNAAIAALNDRLCRPN
jgi:hypothetical protein